MDGTFDEESDKEASLPEALACAKKDKSKIQLAKVEIKKEAEGKSGIVEVNCVQQCKIQYGFFTLDYQAIRIKLQHDHRN